MSRRTDRKHVFALLFQLPFHNELCLSEAAEMYFDQIEEVGDIDRNFVESEFIGTASRIGSLDPLIAKYSVGWDFERISKMDLAVMRLAVYEMLYVDDIPTGVSINEAVELAKIYGMDESAVFINGILGKIASINAAARSEARDEP